RIVDAGNRSLGTKLSLRHLADYEIILVMAGGGDHYVGACCPGLFENGGLRGVAAQDDATQLIGDGLRFSLVLLDDEHLVALVDQRLCQVESDLSSTSYYNVHFVYPR